MAIKCSQCGAALTDSSKFCNYCGAKLPEEVKEDKKRREFRIEFNNENSVRKAEIRAERERERMRYAEAMRQKQMEESRRAGKRLFIMIGILLLIMIFAFIKSGKF